MEIKQIMRSEISCPANQLPLDRVSVNGEFLTQKELAAQIHQKRLNPGHYSYDEVSSLLGKGERLTILLFSYIFLSNWSLNLLQHN